MAHTLAKPAGLPVFPPHRDPSGDCLLARWLTANPGAGRLPWPTGFEGGIAHRLDVSTSGAMLVAEDPDELVQIRQAFADGAFTKTYVFRAAKRPDWRENTCTLPLAHDRRHKRRMVVQRGQHTPHRGRWYPAHTRFEHRLRDLWTAEITTGVMHQIRAHAAFVGLPLLGDRLYGGGDTPPDAPEGLTFFLHHEGLLGGGWRTAAVPPPPWALPAPR